MPDALFFFLGKPINFYLGLVKHLSPKAALNLYISLLETPWKSN